MKFSSKNDTFFQIFAIKIWGYTSGRRSSVVHFFYRNTRAPPPPSADFCKNEAGVIWESLKFPIEKKKRKTFCASRKRRGGGIEWNSADVKKERC